MYLLYTFENFHDKTFFNQLNKPRGAVKEMSFRKVLTTVLKYMDPLSSKLPSLGYECVGKLWRIPALGGHLDKTALRQFPYPTTSLKNNEVPTTFQIIKIYYHHLLSGHRRKSHKQYYIYSHEINSEKATLGMGENIYNHFLIGG